MYMFKIEHISPASTFLSIAFDEDSAVDFVCASTPLEFLDLAFFLDLLLPNFSKRTTSKFENELLIQSKYSEQMYTVISIILSYLLYGLSVEQNIFEPTFRGLLNWSNSICVVLMFLLERKLESRLVSYTEARLDMSVNQTDILNMNIFSYNHIKY